MTVPSLKLNDQHSIPQLGLGTWPLDDAQVAPVIETAVGLGYRHIDTAAKYGNERGVGAGIAATGIPRSELFVTTKLDGEFQGSDRAIAGLEGSLERLGLDYVDLLLIHWPLPQRDEFVSTWRTFIGLRERGLARSIGVSNFTPAHLERLIAETGVTPAVNQVQLSPVITRASWVGEHCFADLDAPVRRLAAIDTPVAYEPTLERAVLPQVDDIAAAVLDLAAW